MNRYDDDTKYHLDDFYSNIDDNIDTSIDVISECCTEELKSLLLLDPEVCTDAEMAAKLRRFISRLDESLVDGGYIGPSDLDIFHENFINQELDEV